MNRQRTLSHGFALLALGWYLMVPPSIHKGSESTTTLEPLSQWENLHSFDTAAACEAGLDEVTKGVREDAAKNPNPKTLMKLNWISDAVCIASDDPRLKK